MQCPVTTEALLSRHSNGEKPVLGSSPKNAGILTELERFQDGVNPELRTFQDCLNQILCCLIYALDY